jgi:hypothetical protein
MLICLKLIFRDNAFKVVRIGFMLLERYIGQSKYAAETIDPDQHYGIIAKITEYRDNIELEDIVSYLDRTIHIVQVSDPDSKASESLRTIIKNFIEELLSNHFLMYNIVLDTRDKSYSTKIISFLISITTIQEDYLESSISDNEFYQYLITPYLTDKFYTNEDIEDGELLARLQLIGYVISFDDNKHLHMLLTYNLLLMIDSI